MSILGNVIGGLLTGALSLVGNLTPSQQNGQSTYGTLSAPILPAFLTSNPLPQGFPWGSLTAGTSNPDFPPTTGVTRVYDFTVTRSVIKPDGVSKDVILINGQFPGPTIEANWGDQIMVTIHNQITSPGEGIGIHWHGFLQKKTQYYDGVASVQQCPIAPGSSFTYNFQADTYGTSWYHSHYSAQYADGLFGPIVIHGPKNGAYDIDLGAIMLSDYFHKSYFEILEGVLSDTNDFSQIVPSSDNNLINGKGIYDCSNTTLPCTPNAGLSKFRFKQGKVHRLRLINTGAEALQRFSIDGHNLTVISNDFVPIQPYTTKVVTLGVGQRVDVLVTANVGGLTDSFWMRSNVSIPCSVSKQPYGLAAIGYDLAPLTSRPTSKPWNVPDPATCANDDLALTVPFYPMTPPAQSDFVQQYDIDFAANASNIFQWSVNGQTFRGNYNAPVLLLANLGNTSYPPEWNVYNYGTNGSVTFVVNNPAGFPAHPMHMHGHNFFVLHQGPGAWDGTVTNPSNPMRRDVIQVSGGSHVAIQIVTDNPGAWPFHCHIAWHVSGGLYITILEQPEQIKAITIPSTLAQGCREWATFTGSTVINQIDSGL
ncbi:ascorbase and Cu-oxidase [Diplocarpon rosae]|nr:ascorbase and Cu-oxidase [Diplocarpon rosae]